MLVGSELCFILCSTGPAVSILQDLSLHGISNLTGDDFSEPFDCSFRDFHCVALFTGPRAPPSDPHVQTPTPLGRGKQRGQFDQGRDAPDAFFPQERAARLFGKAQRTLAGLVIDQQQEVDFL